jgi:16S rRNA (uracil1498-N3)-methyltransferase
MTEPRFYVDLDLQEGALMNLPPQVHRHAALVLRRGAGQTIVLFNGRGGEYQAVIEHADRRNAAVRIGRHQPADRESPLQVTLAQGISRGERMDYAIQKAVELGVGAIQPLLTDHGVVRLSDERWLRKLEHWQGVVIAACEQCGRTRIPAVHPVLDLRDWLSACPADVLKLMLAPGAETVVGSMKAPEQPVVLLAGPEGGFSDMEVRLADLAGFRHLSLGPRVLRTETAGVVALSIIQALWGDLGLSQPGSN